MNQNQLSRQSHEMEKKIYIYYNDLLSGKSQKCAEATTTLQKNVPTNVTLNIKKPSKLRSPKSQSTKNMKPAH